MKTFLSSSIVGVLCGQFAYSAATVVERGIQFTEVDFINSTMTLTNLNENEAVSLSGELFSSKDVGQQTSCSLTSRRCGTLREQRR